MDSKVKKEIEATLLENFKLISQFLNDLASYQADVTATKKKCDVLEIENEELKLWRETAISKMDPTTVALIENIVKSHFSNSMNSTTRPNITPIRPLSTPQSRFSPPLQQQQYPNFSPIRKNDISPDYTSPSTNTPKKQEKIQRPQRQIGTPGIAQNDTITQSNNIASPKVPVNLINPQPQFSSSLSNPPVERKQTNINPKSITKPIPLEPQIIANNNYNTLNLKNYNNDNTSGDDIFSATSSEISTARSYSRLIGGEFLNTEAITPRGKEGISVSPLKDALLNSNIKRQHQQHQQNFSEKAPQRTPQPINITDNKDKSNQKITTKSSTKKNQKRVILSKEDDLLLSFIAKCAEI